MLLERATELAKKILEYQELEETAFDADRFQTRAIQFRTLSKRIAGVRTALEALADAGIIVNYTPTDGIGYAAKAKTLRNALQDNPAVINDPPFDLKHEFRDRITAIAAAADMAMTEAWKAHVAKQADLGANDVLNALAEVPQFRPVVTQVLRYRKDIAALGSSLPTDPKTIVAQIDALVSEHETAWGTLSADNIPRTVISFIRSAANEGVPLIAYTEEVRTWLESRNLLNAFRIRLG